MERKNMLEKALTLAAEAWSALAGYKHALAAVLAGIVGGALLFWQEVQSGKRRWEMSAFVLSLSSSGFFAWATYFVCIEALNWSPGLSVVAAGMIAHVGADKVKAKLLDVFMNRIR
jgi:hypothetical protein